MNKILCLVAVTLLIASSIATGQSTDEIGQVLGKFNVALDGKLSEINAQVAAAVNELSVDISIEAKVRKILRELCKSNQPYGIDAAFIDLDGTMAVIEPQEYRKFEGTHISIQRQVGMAFSSKKPVFSNVFRAVEGMDAVSFQSPIISPEGKLLGSLSILLKPYDLLRSVIVPVIKDTDVDIWVMQTNGLVLFDQDEREIGKNILSDNFYKPYHHLLSICQRIISEKEGAGTYEFLATGRDDIVKKKAVWNTVRMHGTEWRIVYYEVIE